QRKSNEPAKQQIVIYLLHQLPLRPDAVQRLNEECAQQLLRRNRRPSIGRIELAETPVQTPANFPNQSAYRPKWVVGRNALFRQNIRKHCPLIQKLASHGSPCDSQRKNGIMP